MYSILKCTPLDYWYISKCVLGLHYIQCVPPYLFVHVYLNVFCIFEKTLTILCILDSLLNQDIYDVLSFNLNYFDEVYDELFFQKADLKAKNVFQIIVKLLLKPISPLD